MNKKDDSFGTKTKLDLKKNEKNLNFFNKNKGINSNNENNFFSNDNIDNDNNDNNIFNFTSNNSTNNLSSSMASLGIPSLNKKLPFSLQSKPFNLISKRLNTNANTNTNENNNYINNYSGNNLIIHNLSKLSHNKKSNNLLAKIKEKVTKEKLRSKNNKQIKDNEEKLEKNISEPSSKSSNSNTNDEPILDNKIEENPDKKDSNDDEDDILSEQKDEMEEDDNKFLNINRVDSIKIHPSFIQGHNYTGSFSRNSNTSHRIQTQVIAIKVL